MPMKLYINRHWKTLIGYFQKESVLVRMGLDHLPKHILFSMSNHRYLKHQ